MIRKKKSKSLNDTSSLDGNDCRLMKVMKIQEPSPPNETSKINKIRMTTVLPGKYCVPFTSSVTSSSSCYSSLVMMFLTTAFLSGVTSSVNPLPSSPPTVTVNENNNKFFNHHHEVFDKQSSSNITSMFSTTNPAINFTHLTIDPETGRVFVGATNYLYQLNSNLSLEFAFKTGPVEDSPNCSPSDCQEVDSSLIRVTKNTNKILVIDPSSRMLIVCGSVHQGSCRRHSVSDIRSAEPLIGVPVAANDENSSTVAFVSSSRYGNIASSVTSPVMFVAASNSKLGPYRDVVPAISSRSLESGPKLFSIIEKSFTDTARVDIEYHLRDYFIVKYITGFSTRDFVYFATVQRKSHFRALEEWGYISRLSRVCSSDAGYHTYTEMTISCLGPDGTDYNLLQDASVIKTGSILSRSLGIREGQDVLMATFAAAKDHSIVPSTRSAVCLFPLADIEKAFLENIQLCYNGSVSSRNMDYIAGSINECPEPSSSQQKRASLLHNNFCSESIKINGSTPLISTPVIVYENVTLTGITATTTNHHHTIAFVGTSNGSVKKILVSSASTAEEFAEVVVDAGHTILEDVLRDVNGKYIIAASPYKIARIPVDSFLKQDSVVLDKQHPRQQQMRVDHNVSLNQEQNQQQHRQQQRPSETTPIVIKKHLEQPIHVRLNPVIPEKQHEQQQSRLQQNSSIIHKHNERQHRHPQKTQGSPSLTTSASSGFHVPDYVLVFIITGCALFLALLFIVFLLHRKEVSVWLYSKYGIRLQARITASSLSSSSSSREEEKLFDCFISYSKLDEAFVTQVLAPKLENESPSFRLCLNYRDLPFASGYLSYAIIEAMEASRRSILVISENFLENEWCRFEFKSAHLEVLRNNPRHKLILVFIGNINAKDIDPDMRYWMKSSTILLWGEKMFWQKLRYAMPDVSVARKSYQDFLNT